MFDANKLLKALEAEAVKIAPEALKRVLNRLENPAGCERCGARTKMAAEKPDGSLATVCCGHEVAPAPKKAGK